MTNCAACKVSCSFDKNRKEVGIIKILALSHDQEEYSLCDDCLSIVKSQIYRTLFKREVSSAR